MDRCDAGFWRCLQRIQHSNPSRNTADGAPMERADEGFDTLARWGFHFGIIFDLGFKALGQKKQWILQAAEGA
ncbi:hypothetical protein AA100600_2341 [Gluconobacter thailandicus F149-1 = NBRC 100600]|nr:hypothetical protein AA100600_2341 [Gluconobacter thailandicus F149-1 = NBRC 100600]